MKAVMELFCHATQEGAEMVQVTPWRRNVAIRMCQLVHEGSKTLLQENTLLLTRGAG